DMMSFPWVLPVERVSGLGMEEYPSLKRWIEAVKARPAVQKGLAVGQELRQPSLDDEAKKGLFWQKARQEGFSWSAERPITDFSRRQEGDFGQSRDFLRHHVGRQPLG